MTQQGLYDIGVPGQPWGAPERATWLARQCIRRSYEGEVLAKLDRLPAHLVAERYGVLDYTAGRHSLMGLRSRHWDRNKPSALITGGVHGYETSGVQGALRFAMAVSGHFAKRFNLAIAPCVSPWGYETINRWNPDAVDPNRSFVAESPSAECRAVMRWVAGLDGEIAVHIDLHETTDSDNTEFRPAKAARDGGVQTSWNIPDGFYLVGRTDRPVPGFQRAILEAVAKVTHIAAATDGELIGVPIEQPGVVNYDAVGLGLCMGMTHAAFTTTTEMYPDGDRVDDEACVVAQVAAVVGGLEYVMA